MPGDYNPHLPEHLLPDAEPYPNRLDLERKLDNLEAEQRLVEAALAERYGLTPEQVRAEADQRAAEAIAHEIEIERAADTFAGDLRRAIAAAKR